MACLLCLSSCQVPVASVAGLMFMVCIKTFEWSSFRIFSRVPKVDSAVMVLVSAITVWKDLAAAVGAGVVLSALNFAWKSSQQIMASQSVSGSGWRVYKVHSVHNQCARLPPHPKTGRVEGRMKGTAHSFSPSRFGHLNE